MGTDLSKPTADIEHRVVVGGDVRLWQVASQQHMRLPVCLAFLLAADHGQLQWRPSDVDHVVAQGVAIFKHHQFGHWPSKWTSAAKHYPECIRTSRVLHTISYHSTIKGALTPSVVEDTLHRQSCCLVTRGQHVAAVSKRRDGEYLLFSTLDASRLIEVYTVPHLIAYMSRLFEGGKLHLMPLSITRQWVELDTAGLLSRLPDMEEEGKKALTIYLSHQNPCSANKATALDAVTHEPDSDRQALNPEEASGVSQTVQERSTQSSYPKGSTGDNKTVHDSSPEGSLSDNKTAHDSSPEGSLNDNTTVHDSSPEGSTADNKTVHDSSPEGSTADNKTVHDSSPEGSTGDNKTVHDSSPEGSTGDNKTVHDSSPEGSTGDNKGAMTNDRRQWQGLPADLERRWRDLVQFYRGTVEQLLSDQLLLATPPAPRELLLAQEAASLERGTFSYRAPETLAKAAAMETVVRELMRRVSEIWGFFQRATINRTGSYYDGTRVSHLADEFDFLVSLGVDGLTMGKEDEDWCVYLTGTALASCAGQRRRWAGILRCGTGGRVRLHPAHFYDVFRELLDAELGAMALPDGVIHAGLLSPGFTTTTVSGPAVTLSLTWRREPPSTVDITIGIPVPRDQLQGDTLELMDFLCGLAGLPVSLQLTAHLIALDKLWTLSTAVLETRSLAALGPDSRPVILIRGTKLLIRRFLQWRPLDSELAHVRGVLEDLVSAGGGAWGPKTGQLREVAGMADNVKNSLDAGELLLPDRRAREGFIYTRKAALVVAATHRVHHSDTGHVAAAGEGHGAARDGALCTLCEALARVGRSLSYDSQGRLHPAVGEVLGLPAKPWVDMRSTFVKYLVLGDVIESTEALGQTAALLGDLRGYLVRHLMERTTGTFSGSTVAHPLLWAEGDVADISSRLIRGTKKQVDTWGGKVSRDTLRVIFNCHTELCDHLCDVTPEESSQWAGAYHVLCDVTPEEPS